MNLEIARRLAKHAAALVGSRPRILRYADARDRYAVSVAHFSDWPRVGLSTDLTVDLITTPLGLGVEYELLGVSRSEEADMQQLVANAGLRYRAGDIPWAPGAVSHEAVAAVHSGSAMRHLVAIQPVDPMLSIAGPADLELRVRWLQLIPVSDAELSVLEKEGLDGLLGRLEAAAADVTDLDRRSVV